MLSYQGFQCLFWDFFGVDLLSIILINLLGFLISFDGLFLRELCATNLSFLHEDDFIGICEWGDNGWVSSSPLINMLKNESIIIIHYACF